MEHLRKQIRRDFRFEDIISSSPRMHQLFVLLPDVALSPSTVLIEGETGTGKELVARAIHSHSPRHEKAFVAVNCGALPDTLLESELFGYKAGAFTDARKDKPGRFAVAEGGTLFLDEIGDVSPALQMRLLRVLQERVYEPLGSVLPVKADVRIVAATNKNLAEEIGAHRFREDLYYRLNVIPLHIPPLRERKEDIPLLVEHFITRYSGTPRKISPDALKLLINYPWKGNIRELENLIERVLLMTDKNEITAADIPPEIISLPSEHQVLPPMTENGINLDVIVENIEKNYLLEALALAGGVKTEAAKLLNLSFRSFRHRLQKYGIK
jgi:two-component system response regulator PilR (NtrC family)